MKDITDVTIEDLTAYFVKKSNEWTNRTKSTTKKKEIMKHVGRLVLINAKGYKPEYYLFGRVEHIGETYFSIKHNTRRDLSYSSVRELLVENR